MTPEEMLMTHEGVVYPTVFCNPEQFKAMEAFEARSDDVLLAGYCKSGECVCLFVCFPTKVSPGLLIPILKSPCPLDFT